MNDPAQKEVQNVTPSLFLCLGQLIGDCRVAKLLDLNFLAILFSLKILSEEDAMIARFH